MVETRLTWSDLGVDMTGRETVSGRAWPGDATDASPAMTACGRTDVAAMVLSMAQREPAGRDVSYLQWHALDHLPDLYRLPLLRLGTRWVSTAACRQSRLASRPRFDAVDHVVAYLFGSPVDEALASFLALGAAMHGAGRVAPGLPTVEFGCYLLADQQTSAPVRLGADVLPWHPSRGIVLLIETGEPSMGALSDLVATPGVVGGWTFRGTDRIAPQAMADTSSLRTTVCYLDDDPPLVAARLEPVLAKRWADGAVTPLLAAPFVTVVPWAWEASLPG